ncbi:MAG: hypothetical protein HY248_05575 [Fimbriimonas ginsengisoli]|uniref:Uncharacterized protein n=1 Tax=Fimbriimonas ginsengisoli TaxID=1005039 RepID=A0A931PVZ3_FIMGI|nr:hypothetical protein [Fimbriimonas ginsengisoli]MBI3722005.1 hypothetical protein [Fimbriimonas ginsengisoli]
MIAFLAVLAPPDAPAILAIERFSTFMRGLPQAEVQVAVKTSRMPQGGEGRILISRPGDCAYRLTFGKERFEFGQSHGECVEVYTPTHGFDDYLTAPEIESPSFRMSGIGMRLAYPDYIALGSIRAALSKGASYRYGGRSKTGGTPVDLVNVVLNTPAGTRYAKLFLADDGRLLRDEETWDFIGGRLTRTLEIKSYKLNANSATAQFAIKVPRGFSPFTTPPEPQPLGLDNALPSGSVVEFGSGRRKPVADAVGKPGLLVVTDPAWAASTIGAQALAEAGKLLAEFRGNVTLLAATRGPSALPTDFLYDPTGAVLAALSPPGYPMFYLVDKEGKIERMWLGFNPKETKLMMREMRGALEKGDETRRFPRP